MSNSQRVAIYTRVSTADQSCDLQKQELVLYAKARGWMVVNVYEDKATGTNANRLMLKSLMQDAQERRVDIVLVWKLDRFARSLRDLVVMLQQLTDVGVAFVSLKDNIDLTTAAGRLMVHMLGAFAEFEASLIRERVRSGIRHARAQGKRIGRPLLRDDEQIRALRGNGLSIRGIAKRLCISPASVQRALKVSA